jgi:hypothetical protein
MDSVSDRLLGVEPGMTRSKDCFDVLNIDRRLVKITESCSRCFQDAAAAGAQLTITAMFNSTALHRVISDEQDAVGF